MTERPDDPLATLACYADGPAQLDAALAGLKEADLDLGPEEGGWTIRQIVHHIADGDDLWGACVKMSLGSQTGFSLQWYWARPQDEWAQTWHYADRAVEPSLALFRANRAHIVQLVEREPDAWARHMVMQMPGGREESVTVGDIIAMQARHVLGHIADIRRIRETHHL
jgi:uncharacterized damage-inducible protein DinB